MTFVEKNDSEFQEVFTNIIDLSTKDTTYKFAFARFLVEYSSSKTEERVDFSTIAEYFLKYYWNLECKYKIKQGNKTDKQPLIVKIIKEEFTESYYPESFEEIQKKESKKIQWCIQNIKKDCFHDVTKSFQKVKTGKKTKNEKIFFDFREKNSRKIDLDYGIKLKPEAMKFFKKHNPILKKAITLEWAKKLEILNLGVPRLIAKTEGIVKRGSLSSFKKDLEPFFKTCFYCKKQLEPGKETHVDHLIPFDYIADDQMWNFVLSCQKCNCEKLSSLPPEKFLDGIISRNTEFRYKIKSLDKSLTVIGTDFEKIIKEHYKNAKSHGYSVLENFPN